jgi:Xaa-Pro aminopeptidase
MERKAYTLVMKGNIALEKATFPKGTSGFALDALARQFLWAEGLDYRHGTGHGVGSFLVSQANQTFVISHNLSKVRMYMRGQLALGLGSNIRKYLSLLET